jgi:hypothetical protein
MEMPIPWSRVLIEKQTVPQSLPGNKLKQTTPSLPVSLKTISVFSPYLRPGLTSGLLPYSRVTIFVGIKKMTFAIIVYFI